MNEDEEESTQVPTSTNYNLDYYQKFDLHVDKSKVNEIDVVSVDANKRPSSI